MAGVKSIHHVAVVVEDIETSLNFWRDALGLEMTGRRDVPAEAAEIAFLEVGGSEIELVRPTSEESGLARYLAKRGPGMHHLCVEVEDILTLLEKMRDHNIRLINEEPRSGTDGRQYAFIHPESTGGVLVELYQLS
ncbi:MAG: methylmalonyl-CoA epimerase [Anaerolineales bacterium]|nr:methylmalonyl-CoA epimerase [Anaerolineales bacterium]